MRLNDGSGTTSPAVALIQQFQGRSGPSPWRSLARVGRQAIASDLLARVDDPNIIDQASTSLCGPAVFTRAVASMHPEWYARAVIGLYEDAKAEIGSLKVVASDGLRGCAPPPDTAAADWVILASIRNSENYLPYRENSSIGPIQLPGDPTAITLPGTLADWFRRADFGHVFNNTNLTGWSTAKPCLSNYFEAVSKLRPGCAVCLFINSNMIANQGSFMNGNSLIPNHWVGLISNLSIDEKGLRFVVYSWGSRMEVPQRFPLLTMSAEHLRFHYFGYLAAEL